MAEQMVVDRRPPPGAAMARASLLLVVVAGLNGLGGWFAGQIDPAWIPATHDSLETVWLLAALAYVLAMALPFVPGIEIGLALMMLLGDSGILLVYLSTQLALALSFGAGRLIPVPVLQRLFLALKLSRAAQLLGSVADECMEDRLATLRSMLPQRCGRLLRHRHVALAVLLNLPGNAMAGGAGGIGLIAGASRLYSFPRYCALMAVATSPVPLLLLMGGAL